MSKTKANTVVELKGNCETWPAFGEGEARRYMAVTVPYGVAKTLFKPDHFKPGGSGERQGEQRQLVASHVRGLVASAMSGQFTPTAVSVGLRKRHRESLRLEGNNAAIAINPDDPLPLTDGQQRFGMLAAIAAKAEETQDEALLAKVNATPVTAMVLFDGDTRADFINLQLGKAMDPALLQSLKVATKTLPAAEQAAYKVAKALEASKESPFSKLLRFSDQDSGTAAIKKMPWTTLAARGSSDLATSLCGLVRVCGEKAEPERLAHLVIQAVSAIEKAKPALLEQGKPLATPMEGGGKGSATMLVGLGVCLAYRLKEKGRELPEKDDLAKLVKAAEEALDRGLDGSFSSADKRQLMNDFATEFFGDLKCDKHQGIPMGLLRELSCSAFQVTPLTKAQLKPPATDEQYEDALRAYESAETDNAAA